MTHVFVYGTLKRGHRNHQYLAGQQFLGEARTVSGYTLYSMGNHPGMVHSTDASHDVTGELWAVDDDCLARLDILEGVGKKLYERVAVQLAPPFVDESVQTYLYLRTLKNRKAIGSTWTE
ncbi:MAG TPA: gamma-glutamylcyclotransferase family protein [Lacunisphaera sp.]|nr:gamma-glutamylcyclotransferase family protein [Lacunisphaera sp.]